MDGVNLPSGRMATGGAFLICNLSEEQTNIESKLTPIMRRVCFPPAPRARGVEGEGVRERGKGKQGGGGGGVLPMVASTQPTVPSPPQHRTR